MIEKTKNYFKDNFWQIIVAAMVAGFFAQYQYDRSKIYEKEASHDAAILNQAVINQNVASTMAYLMEKQQKDDDRNTYKIGKIEEQLTEIWKMMPRGAKTKTVNIDNP